MPASLPGPDMDVDTLLQMMKDTILIAVQRYNYKGGAYAAAVSTTSPVLDDLNTIINSPLLSKHEKDIFSQMKRSTIILRNLQARGEKPPDGLQMITLFSWAMELEEITAADAKKRGQYVPPTMMQAMGDNGEVEESFLFDNEGGVTRHAGGKPGVVPGAPEAFNQAQAEACKDFWSGVGDGRVGVGSFAGATAAPADKFPPSASASQASVNATTTVGSGKSKHSSATPAPSDVEIPTAKPKDGKKFGGFGKGFEGNLRNAFL